MPHSIDKLAVFLDATPTVDRQGCISKAILETVSDIEMSSHIFSDKCLWHECGTPGQIFRMGIYPLAVISLVERR